MPHVNPNVSTGQNEDLTLDDKVNNLVTSPNKYRLIMTSEDKLLLRAASAYFCSAKKHQDAHHCVTRLQVLINDIQPGSFEEQYWGKVLLPLNKVEKMLNEALRAPEEYAKKIVTSRNTDGKKNSKENVAPKNTGRPPRSPFRKHFSVFESKCGIATDTSDQPRSLQFFTGPLDREDIPGQDTVPSLSV